MSFGALSFEAKLALTKATTKAGSMANSGEGGMLPEERDRSDLFALNNQVSKITGISMHTWPISLAQI